MCVEDFNGRVCWGLQRVEVKIPPDVRVSPRAAVMLLRQSRATSPL